MVLTYVSKDDVIFVVSIRNDELFETVIFLLNM